MQVAASATRTRGNDRFWRPAGGCALLAASSSTRAREPRTVCVHPAIIIAALRQVYDRPALADELEGTGDGYE